MNYLLVSGMTESWTAQIEYMVARGCIEDVMIISAEDGALWATSSEDNFFLREYKV